MSTSTTKSIDKDDNEILPIAMIYRIENLNNNLKYYGLSQNHNKRWNGHINPPKKSKHYLANVVRVMKKKDPTLKFEWLSKTEGLYGNLRFKVIKIYENSITGKTLKELEIQYISFFNTFEGYGYNNAPGGDGVSIWTDDMRVNISNTRKRKYALERTNDPDYTRKRAEEQGCREFIAVNLETGEYRYQDDGRPWVSHIECAENVFGKRVRIGKAFRDSKFHGRAKNPLLRVDNWCFIYTDDPDEISKEWIKNAKKSLRLDNRKFKVYEALTGDFKGEFSNQRECCRILNLGTNTGNVSNMLNGNNANIKHVKGHVVIWSDDASSQKINELLVSARERLIHSSIKS